MYYYYTITALETFLPTDPLICYCFLSFSSCLFLFLSLVKLSNEFEPDALRAFLISLSHQGASVPQWHSCSLRFVFILNPPAPVKLSHLASSPSSSSPPSWPPQAPLDSQSAVSLYEGRGDAAGSLDVDPQPLELTSQENLRDLGPRPCHDVSTLTGRSHLE